MKTIIVTLFISVTSSIAWAQNDFRNVKWGMSLDEVKKAETAPLTTEGRRLVGAIDGKRQYDGMELVYDEVTVAGNKATLYYFFENGRLIQCRALYRYGFYLKPEDDISTKILTLKPLYEALKTKGFEYIHQFQCGERVGEIDRSDPDNNRLNNMKEFSQETLNLIEKMISEKKYKSVFFHAKNDRSLCSLDFPTKYNDAIGYYAAALNIYPSGDLKKKIDSSDF